MRSKFAFESVVLTVFSFPYFSYNPMANDLLTNAIIPGNTMSGSGWCIFVYNLAPETEDNVLWQLFGPFGAVQSVKVGLVSLF